LGEFAAETAGELQEAVRHLTAERETVRAEMALIENELDALINAPVSGGRDPFEWLSDECPTWSVTMLCVKESHTIRVIATCCSQVLEHLFAQEIEAALGSDSDTYVHFPSSSLPPVVCLRLCCSRSYRRGKSAKLPLLDLNMGAFLFFSSLHLPCPSPPKCLHLYSVGELGGHFMCLVLAVSRLRVALCVLLSPPTHTHTHMPHGVAIC
jgi:hypothetical protein